MSRVPTVLLLLLVACSMREIEDEGESRRHIAAQWCEDFCTFQDDCEPNLPSTVGRCRDSCESDDAWDWTDECGDIIWAYRQCKESKTCEELADDPTVPNETPACQAHMTEFVRQGCTYES